MRHRIDPKVDCVFKAVLGKEENKNLLIHFLNAILDLPEETKIQEVLLLNPYNEREFETDKLSVVDIKAKDRQGRHYQVEIQLALHTGLTARILYTWSAIYHSLLKKSDEFIELEPVVSIWILNENIFDDIDAYHLPFYLYDPQHALILTNHLAIHLLQLAKWQLSEKHVDEADRWMYFFREGEDVDVDHLPVILETKEMKQAMGVLQQFSESEKNYFLYENRLEAQRVEATWKGELRRAKEKLTQAEQKAAQAEQKAVQAEQKAVQAEQKAVQAEQKAVQAEQKAAQAEQEAAQAEQEAAQAKIQAQEQIEQERKEKERLLELLKKAGIDPKQSQ